jgi:cytidine deaminase
MCAERTAIYAGVTAGFTNLAAIAISTLNRDNEPVPCFKPCGACLQVIAEFGKPDTRIILDNDREYALLDFLPHGFCLP